MHGHRSLDETAKSGVTSPALQSTFSAIVRDLLDLLQPRERRLLGWVVLASLFTAGVETVGVASILPFMTVVVDPVALSNYPILGTVATAVGAHTWHETVIWAAALTGAMVALGNGARLCSSWLQWRFEARTRHRMAADLLRAYLRAPYAFHVGRDAASLKKIISHDVASVTGNILMPLLTAASRGFIVISLLGLLAVQSPVIAFTAFAALGGAYLVIFRVMKRRQSRLGEHAGQASYEWQLTSTEALGGIKELIVLDRRETIAHRFADADRRLAEISISRKIAEAAPRHLLEVLTFGCILAVTVAIVSQSDTPTSATVPTLTLYAFVGYRLLPGLQQLYGSAISLRYGMPALKALHRDWAETAAAAPRPASITTERPVPFHDRISLRDVTFTYSGSSRPALSGVSLDIRRGERIGIIGRSGAGKSTLGDLLLGLFEPTSGVLTIDGVPLTPVSIDAWRSQVGYVAQHIFLGNSSVSENIGFGLGRHDIDLDRVRESAQLAQIHDFVEALPQGYDTIVGERGVRLSGGERQRIGIARALYRRPTVLIFDEATSALDGLTQEALMEAIRSLSGDRTIVLIAHRLRTLDVCDRLILLDAGRVSAIGSRAEVQATSDAFARFLARS